MTSLRYILLACAALLLLVLPAELTAQPPDTIKTGVTTEGKEFWVVFQKNFRDFQENTSTKSLEPSQPLELTLFITSSKRAQGYVEVAGIGYRREFVVEAGEVIEIPVDSAAQLRSSEVVENLAVHIVSNEPIAVYGLSHRYQTTDTYLAYPIDVLGTRYRAVGYKWLADDLLSQFAVIATEDNTTVTITPSSRTSGGKPANVPFTVILNRGETYQVIPKFEVRSSSDLTGSIISSNKPIAVFSGHNCAYVPDRGYKACNILVEQIPPVRSWGRQFFVGTLAGRASSVIRVLANEDETEVFENNSKVATLKAGDYYENPNLKVNTMLTSSKPVLVAQYAKGYTAPDPVSRRADSVGDPMMIVVAPTEQFLSNYRFATPVTGNWEHYINVIVPTGSLGSLRLNGEKINPDRFTVFGISRYSIAQIKLPYGTYSITGSKPFGLYSYGFGFMDKIYDAYGNGGGQSMLQIIEIPDRIAPMISAVTDRFTGSINGVVRDDRLNDSGIETVEVVEFENLKVEIEAFEKGAPQASVKFRPVIDRTPGFAVMSLKDRAGNKSRRTVCVQYDEFGDTMTVVVLPAGETCDFAPKVHLGFSFEYGGKDSDLLIGAGSELLGNPVDLFGSGGEPSYAYTLAGSMSYNSFLKLTGRIGLDFWSNSAYGYWTDTAARPLADDGTPLNEEFHLQRDVTWLSISPGVRYYPVDPQTFIFGSLNLGIPLAVSETFTRTLQSPSNYVYENGTNQVVQYEGSGPSGLGLLIAPEIGVGAEFGLQNGFTVVGELGGGFSLTTISPDRSWSATWLFGRLGVSKSFRL